MVLSPSKSEVIVRRAVSTWAEWSYTVFFGSILIVVHRPVKQQQGISRRHETKRDVT